MLTPDKDAETIGRKYVFEHEPVEFLHKDQILKSLVFRPATEIEVSRDYGPIVEGTLRATQKTYTTAELATEICDRDAHLTEKDHDTVRRRLDRLKSPFKKEKEGQPNTWSCLDDE